MAKIELASARTDKTDPTAAAEALVSGLGGGEPKLVTLFAARDHDHAALNRAVRERLPKRTRLIGASTGGEEPPAVRLAWLGKSNDRQPDKVLAPLFAGALDRVGVDFDLSTAGEVTIRASCALPDSEAA